MFYYVLLLTSQSASGPPWFFRVHVTLQASPDKDLGLAGRPERQTWKSVQAWWKGFLIEGKKEALRHSWCLEKSEGERAEHHIFSKGYFVYRVGFVLVAVQQRQD